MHTRTVHRDLALLEEAGLTVRRQGEAPVRYRLVMREVLAIVRPRGGGADSQS